MERARRGRGARVRLNFLSGTYGLLSMSCSASEELEPVSAETGESMVTGEGGASEALPPPPLKGVIWTASSQSKSKVSLLPSEEFNRSLGAEVAAAE